jgi:hypothetical protein
MRLFQRWKEGKNFVLSKYLKLAIRKSVIFFEWPSTRPEIDIIANQASEISTDFKCFLCGFSEGFMNAKTGKVCTATAGPLEAGRPPPPQIFADQLTLFYQGAISTHHIK